MTTPASDADAGGGRMGQTIVAPDDTADAKRGEKRRHDPDTEDPGTAMIARAHPARCHAGRVVIAAKHVTDDQHANEQKKPERAERDIDEHPCVTLHPPSLTVNMGAAAHGCGCAAALRLPCGCRRHPGTAPAD